MHTYVEKLYCNMVATSHRVVENRVKVEDMTTELWARLGDLFMPSCDHPCLDTEGLLGCYLNTLSDYFPAGMINVTEETPITPSAAVLPVNPAIQKRNSTPKRGEHHELSEYTSLTRVFVVSDACFTNRA